MRGVGFLSAANGVDGTGMYIHDWTICTATRPPRGRGGNPFRKRREVGDEMQGRPKKTHENPHSKHNNNKSAMKPTNGKRPDRATLLMGHLAYCGQ